MVANKRGARETKRRIAQMEAKRELRAAQSKRRVRDNVIGSVVAVLLVALAVVLQLTVFSSNPTAAQYQAAQAGLNASTTPSGQATPEATPSAQASGAASPSVSLPPIPDPSVAAGQTFTGTLSLNAQPLSVQLDGTKAPQAAAVFKTLADSGFFVNKTCHRLTTSGIFVLQCGSVDGLGSGVPTFSWGPVENAPTDNVYPAGTIAVARAGDDANSNGTQFFITYQDSTIPADTAGGYTVVGTVTSGLEVVTQIAAAGTADGTSDGPPMAPVTIDSFTLN